MELVQCKCAGCDATLGIFINLWIQIGSKYMAPAACDDHDSALSVATTGSLRLGQQGTLVEGCQLQDAQCASCHAKLGQKCAKTPVNHPLDDGQFILRIDTIGLRLASDRRRKVEPRIKRVLKLKVDLPREDEEDEDEGKPRHFRDYPYIPEEADAATISELQAHVAAQRQTIARIGTAGFQRISSLEAVVTRVEQQARSLEESIETLQKDGVQQRDDLKVARSELINARDECLGNDTIPRLEQRLRATEVILTGLSNASSGSESETSRLRREVSQLREENARLKDEMMETREIAREGITASKEYASEIASLKREMKQVRAELAEEREQRKSTDSTAFSPNELDILATSISKIGNRASHIESLQMEFELFKTRVHRLEARRSTGKAGRNDAAAVFSSEQDELSRPWFEPHARQKRTSTGGDDGPDVTPQKRIAVSSDYSTTATAEYVTAGDVQQPPKNNLSTSAAPHQPRPHTMYTGTAARRVVDGYRG